MGRLAPPPPRLVHQNAPATSAAATQVVNHYSNNDKLIPAIPGFRTSAAFLTSLSANLRIDPDLPSPLLTPNFARSSSYGLPPPSPLSFSTTNAAASQTHHTQASPAPNTLAVPPRFSPYEPPKSPTEHIPKLNTYTAESDDERVAGLRLVADSVSQQRQVAAKALVFHPVNLTIYFVVIAVLTRYMWHSNDDLLLLGTIIGGVTMVALAAIRLAVGGYLGAAEGIDWEWLGEDKMVVVKWGEAVIGALVLGWADNSEGARKRGSRRRRGKAVVRAWTVKQKYRGKGIGESLLEEAVKVAGVGGADGIVFDAEHANSKRILPGIYNGFLNKQEARAEKALEKVADEKGNFRQRRSSPTWGSR